MSYCRFIEADVYVFEDTGGFFCCCGCSLSEINWGSFNCTHRSQMIDHLKKHQELGDYVPEHVFDRLKQEIYTDGDECKRKE